VARADAPRRAVFGGGALALGAALAFGATTPLVQRFGRGLGPFGTAAILYAGSAAFAAASPRRPAAPMRRSDVPRLVGVTLLGAVLAPIALAWGLQRTSGVVASLLLNLEVLFTVVLARLVWAERIGRRVAAALGATLAGGALLVLDGRAASSQAGWGAVAIVGATLAWAADGVFGRPLSERDPSHIVLAKGALGAALSLGLAAAGGEGVPSLRALAALGVCGAIGYGASLRMYLGAQRAIGAARTGTVFAAAPFIGASVAWAMGERAGGALTLTAALLCAAGVALQLTESHDHMHVHEAEEHDHPHRHDDGHHDHAHDDAHDDAHDHRHGDGEHSHPHRHDRLAHAHPHGEDAGHRHEH
jgi:drug/metabolite transporter (DMT)-like permease